MNSHSKVLSLVGAHFHRRKSVVPFPQWDWKKWEFCKEKPGIPEPATFINPNGFDTVVLSLSDTAQ